MTASKFVQSTADLMTKYDRGDYVRADIRGSCTLFSTPVYTLTGHKAECAAEGKRGELTNKLTKDNGRDLVDFVIGQVKQWAELETSTQSADDGSVSVWASDTLQHDLGIPLGRKPPDCVILQVVVVGRNLPAFVLTLYQSHKTTDQVQKAVKEIRTFTTQTAQLLTASIIRFSHTDFVLLPCVLERDGFGHKRLKTEVDEQLRFSRRYFRGPGQLNNESFNDLKEAIVAVFSASYVPCLLEGSHKQKEWLLLLEGYWRQLLFGIIETVTHKGVCDLVYTPQTEFQVKVALLEAAKRLVVTENVFITTSDPAVESCVKQITKLIEQEHGADVSKKLDVEVIPGNFGHISIACPGRSSTDTDTIPLKEGRDVLSQQYDCKGQSHQKIMHILTSPRCKTHHLSSPRSPASKVEDLLQEIETLHAEHGPAELRKVDKDELTLKELQLEKALLYAQYDHSLEDGTEKPRSSTDWTSSPKVDDAMKHHKLARIKSSPGWCVGQSYNKDTFSTDKKLLGSTWPSPGEPGRQRQWPLIKRV